MFRASTEQVTVHAAIQELQACIFEKVARHAEPVPMKTRRLAHVFTQVEGMAR